MSSNASASDSAKINVVRNPIVYPEPVSLLKAVGRFDCVIQRSGGLREEFSSYNNITLNGKQQLIYGIAKTNNHFVNLDGEASRTGMYFSSAGPGPANDAAVTEDIADFTATANITADETADTIEGTGTAGDVEHCPVDVFLKKSGTDGVDIFGESSPFGSTNKALESSPIKVVAGGAATIGCIILCDASAGTGATSKDWCGAAVDVTLASTDTLTATYTLSIS